MHSNSPRPAVFVKDFVNSNIGKGIWKPGELLPSESSIAKELSVNRLTVNRVFGELVREGILYRQRGIGTAVAKQGVQPSTRSSDEKFVGFLAGHDFEPASNPFFGEMLESIREFFSEKGYYLVPMGSIKDQKHLAPSLTNPFFANVSGVIILGPVSPRILEELRKLKQTFVFVEFTECPSDFVNVSSSDVVDSSQITHRIIDMGHRKIVHINSRPTLEARLTGFISAMEERNIQLPFRYVVDAPNLEIEGGYEAMRQFYELKLPFSIVYGATDNLALGAIQFLREAGLRFPTDVSVVGFDGIAFSQQHRPRLTTMKIDRRGLATKASELLLDMVLGKNVVSPPLQPSHWIEGETLGAPVSPMVHETDRKARAVKRDEIGVGSPN